MLFFNLKVSLGQNEVLGLVKVLGNQNDFLEHIVIFNAKVFHFTSFDLFAFLLEDLELVVLELFGSLLNSLVEVLD